MSLKEKIRYLLATDYLKKQNEREDDLSRRIEEHAGRPTLSIHLLSMEGGAKEYLRLWKERYVAFYGYPLKIISRVSGIGHLLRSYGKNKI